MIDWFGIIFSALLVSSALIAIWFQEARRR